MISLPSCLVSITLARRLWPAILVLPLLSPPSMADEPMNVTKAEQCRAIADSSDRLLCYDTVVDGGVFNEQKADQAKRESFGITKKEPENTPDRITVTIVRIQDAAAGVQYFYTADGAIWQKNDRGQWHLDVPFDAELKSGALGSFFLVTDGGKSARVKRIR